MRVEIGAATGNFRGALKERAWTLRIHPPANWPENLVAAEVQLAGATTHALARKLKCDATAMPFGNPAGAPDGDVFEVSLPLAPVSEARDTKVIFAP